MSTPAIHRSRPKALQIHVGPRAMQALAHHGLKPQDVLMVPAAAGGPKGLVLNAIDQLLFADWLPRGEHVVHLVGASIGAWRLSAACIADSRAGLQAMVEAYITQDYPHAPGQVPPAAEVSAVFGQMLQRQLGAEIPAMLAHERYRLHLVTAHGRHVLSHGQPPWLVAMGYAAACLCNAVHRPALGAWLERVVFSDPRTPLPVPLADLRTQRVALAPHNLLPALLASCAIPFWLDAVHDIPGAPRGAYWDGGITDYHLHWAYHAIPATTASQGLVLYPHFQTQLVPGWLDKRLKGRHHATPWLDNVIVLSPRPEWVATLPNAKLPDRDDFKRYGDDAATRMRLWREAVSASEQLADELAAWLAAGTPLDAVVPLR